MDETGAELEVDLTRDERTMLTHGLRDWGGPAHPVHALALLMGCRDVAELVSETERISGAVVRGRPLSRLDWTRALVATEVAFASKVFGTGDQWTTILGSSDAHWVTVLRHLQAKLPATRDALPTSVR